jgi:hypothetical protein
MCLYLTQQKVPESVISRKEKKEQGQIKFRKSRGISQGLCFLMDLNYNFHTFFMWYKLYGLERVLLHSNNRLDMRNLWKVSETINLK